MNQNKKLGLITVLYNSPNVLDDFFASLSLQDHDNYHLYIIDNSSIPEPLEKSRQLTQLHNIPVTFIDNKGNNVGVAAGNNQGIVAALNDVCDYVLFINNDLIFEMPSTLSDLMGTMQADSLAMCSPVILNYPAKKIWYAGGYIDTIRAIAPHHDIDASYLPSTIARASYAYAPTCFLMVTAELLNRVGCMDEKYFAYYDDTDFLFRCNQAGYFVELLPNIVIYHKVGSSTGGDLSYFGSYHLARNRIYFIRKNIGGLKRYVSLVYSVLTRYVRSLSVSPELSKAIRKGISDGFKM
ncbi:glycosyltransferase family 2 protein [Shewanella baltica]|uniref:glycosyltransferase family 2 protein n=1 Tax=Shewanella baltica TaxID=62322 RepID=UPI003D796517